jgi:hypothetical protein
VKKTVFAIAIFALIIQGCKKEENGDTRDPMVGTWDVYQIMSFPSSGLIHYYHVNYSIKKDVTDKTRIKISDGTRTIVASVNGSTYSYTYTYHYPYGSIYRDEVVISTGGIIGNRLTETGTATNGSIGSAYAGTWSATGIR